MSLLGNGAMVFWHDVAEGEDDYKDWHSNEHMTERVGIPGFLRGRRACSVHGAPAYLILYEVDSVEVLTSTAYLERLNHPSPWTQRVLARYRNSNRTLCRTEGSWGLGVGSSVLTVQIAPGDGTGPGLRDWLQQSCLVELARHGAIVGAHLLIADSAASLRETAEKSLRDRPDEVADWVVLVEAYDAAVLRPILDDTLHPDRLEARGAAPGTRAAIYQLEHVVSAEDVRGARIPG